MKIFDMAMSILGLISFLIITTFGFNFAMLLGDKIDFVAYCWVMVPFHLIYLYCVSMYFATCHNRLVHDRVYKNPKQ